MAQSNKVDTQKLLRNLEKHAKLDIDETDPPNFAQAQRYWLDAIDVAAATQGRLLLGWSWHPTVGH